MLPQPIKDRFIVNSSLVVGIGDSQKAIEFVPGSVELQKISDFFSSRFPYTTVEQTDTDLSLQRRNFC